MDDWLPKPFAAGDLYRLIALRTIEYAAAEPTPARQIEEPKPVDFASLLDERMIRSLKSAAGADGAGLLDKVGRLYLETVPKDLIDLESAIDRGAADRVCSIAHKLRSIAGNIGARELAKLFKSIEDGASAGQLRGAHAVLREIAIQFEQSAIALRREMSDA